jgi:hypothetical protein
MQSAAMRMHSNACFCEWSDSDTAYLLETRVLHRCTASHVLSVVYATEKSRENNGCAHPRDAGIVESTAQMAAHSVAPNPTAKSVRSLPVDSEADDEVPTFFWKSAPATTESEERYGSTFLLNLFSSARPKRYFNSGPSKGDFHHLG